MFNRIDKTPDMVARGSGTDPELVAELTALIANRSKASQVTIQKSKIQTFKNQAKSAAASINSKVKVAYSRASIDGEQATLTFWIEDK